MSTVNVKIGDNIYNNVSTINVDTAEGGTADFIYKNNEGSFVITADTNTIKTDTSISRGLLLRTNIELEVGG